MNTTIHEFSGWMAQLWGAYAKPTPEDSIVMAYFSELSKYDSGDVRRAVDHFISQGSPSGWPPVLPQLLNQMPCAPQRVDLEFLRAQLIKPTTTVGALACAAVSSHDRKMMGDPSADRSIKTSLTSFIQNLPELTKEITEGRGYNRDQIAVLKSGRYPNLDHTVFAGVAIQPQSMQANRQRALLMQERGQLAIEANPTEPMDKTAKMHPSISAKLAALVADLDTAEPEVIKNELDPCTNCRQEFEAILNICPRCGEKR